jgi:hypothetical protein
MLDVASQDTIEIAQPTAVVQHWSLATRMVFRFCFLYFGLYALITQMLGGFLLFPKWEMPPLQELPPLKDLVTWTAVHVFGITRPLVITGSGSGDKTFDWVAAFCLLMVSSTATVLWSVLDRKRQNYVFVHKWFHLFLRYSAGSTMLLYGMVKAFPLQMPAPYLTRLLEPFGNFSPMGVLWASIGASPAYERFAGCAELAAAVCLFIPRLSLVGAVIMLADSIQIFTLNMTYDVPVKLFSFHLVLMALTLLAPDVRRLCQAVFHHRVKWLAATAQVAFCAYLVAVALYGSAQRWRSPSGGGAPRPPLYGIWTIDKMTIDSVERAPLVTDYERWRRVVIQNATSVTFWRMDDTPLTYQGKVDLDTKTITLTPTPNSKSVLTIQQPAADRLILDGDLDGKTLHIEGTYFDRSRFLLLSRGFNWIQELPFNR